MENKIGAVIILGKANQNNNAIRIFNESFHQRPMCTTYFQKYRPKFKTTGTVKDIKIWKPQGYQRWKINIVAEMVVNPTKCKNKTIIPKQSSRQNENRLGINRR